MAAAFAPHATVVVVEHAARAGGRAPGVVVFSCLRPPGPQRAGRPDAAGGRVVYGQRSAQDTARDGRR
ncbi:hypothetical protein JL996_19115, partial [Acinetobacter baumannii]|uniref:hypothetical protein n=1 Tax=Acinetobacter baumannii TaxID=470 RepID=UPI001C44AA07